MAKIQSYKDGYIDKRSNGTYRFIVKNKVKGTYNSVAELVKEYDGKQNRKQKTAKKTESITEAFKEVTKLPEQIETKE